MWAANRIPWHPTVQLMPCDRTKLKCRCEIGIVRKCKPVSYLINDIVTTNKIGRYALRAFWLLVSHINPRHTNHRNDDSKEHHRRRQGDNWHPWQAWSQSDAHCHVNRATTQNNCALITCIAQKFSRRQIAKTQTIHGLKNRLSHIHSKTKWPWHKTVTEIKYFGERRFQQILRETSYLCYVKWKPTVKMTAQHKDFHLKWAREDLGWGKKSWKNVIFTYEKSLI